MKRKNIKVLLVIFISLFVSGCGPPSTVEVVEGGLRGLFGFYVASIVVVGFFNYFILIQEKNKFRLNKLFWIQYIIPVLFLFSYRYFFNPFAFFYDVPVMFFSFLFILFVLPLIIIIAMRYNKREYLVYTPSLLLMSFLLFLIFDLLINGSPDLLLLSMIIFFVCGLIGIIRIITLEKREANQNKEIIFYDKNTK